MQARERFAARGFIILYQAIPDATINAWRQFARHSDELLWYSTAHDVAEGRIQAALPDDTARFLTSMFKRHYKTFFPESHTADWRFVKTVAGATDQSPRREFVSPPSSDDLMDVCSLPGSIIIATQDDTFLYGFGWNQQVPLLSNRKLIELNKGDIILFRGDFIYSPVGYETNNLCVQAYLDMPRYQRTPDHVPHLLKMVDDTQPNDDPFCYVWNCEFCSSGATSLRKHLNRYHCFKFKATGRSTEE